MLREWKGMITQNHLGQWHVNTNLHEVILGDGVDKKDCTELCTLTECGKKLYKKTTPANKVKSLHRNAEAAKGTERIT
jgi:hypothetical protein